MSNSIVPDDIALWIQQWPDGLIALDAEGVVQWISNKGSEILRWQQRDMIGLCAHDTLCVEAREMDHTVENCPLVNPINDSFTNASGMHSTYWLANNGEFVSVDFRVTKITGDTSTRFLLHFQETQQSQHSIAELEKFASFVDKNPAAIAEFDASGQMMFGNTAMQELLLHYGFDDDGLGVIFPENLDALCEKCCANHESVTHVELQAGTQWFSWHFHPLLGANSTSTIGYAFDATALKQAEQDAKTARAEARRDFYAKMMHELRTPLNAIVGYADLLLIRSADNLEERDRRALKGIKIGGVQLNELISDTLDISKIEAGRMTVDVEEFYLTDVFSNIEEQLSYLAEAKKLQYIVNCSAEITPRTDKQKIRQILINLISNAIKYTRKGEVKVDARMGPDETFILQVHDTGIGIPQEQIEILFHAYEQVRESKNRGIQGTGLGLALVKELVAALGGSVDVQSEYGEGSTFSVTLPLKYEPQE